MRILGLSTLVLIFALLLPLHTFADAEKWEWIGKYSMNHDGHQGVLTIAEIKADCATSAWCDLVISYQDAKGVKHLGTIEKIDNKGQRMVFYIEFPDNKQKFEAYLFSWDKNKLAGVTYWGERTFCFYAVKK